MGLVLKVKSSALIEEPLIVVHLICMCTHTVFITTGVTIIVQFMKPMFGSIKLCHFFMSATPEISKKQYLDRFVYFQHPFSTIGLFHLRGSQCFNTISTHFTSKYKYDPFFTTPIMNMREI
jgi:hypothetical protein